MCVEMCRADSHGTCWHECSCDDQAHCSFPPSEAPCASFTCDEPSYRRKGQALECVQDQCTKVYTEHLVKLYSSLSIRDCTLVQKLPTALSYTAVHACPLLHFTSLQP